jgi:hypothetical protein
MSKNSIINYNPTPHQSHLSKFCSMDDVVGILDIASSDGTKTSRTYVVKHDRESGLYVARICYWLECRSEELWQSSNFYLIGTDIYYENVFYDNNCHCGIEKIISKGDSYEKCIVRSELVFEDYPTDNADKIY